MKKKHVVELTAADRAQLCTIVRSGQASARKVLRAKILLKADRRGENCTDQEIAETLDIGVATVERVRARYAREGHAALERRPQPPRPQKRRLDGKGEAQLVMLACSRPPEGHGRWTLDLLADRMVKLNYAPEISRDTVGRTLKKTRSSPG
jgi:transposase